MHHMNVEQVAVWCCAGLAAIVFAVMLFSFATFRRKADATMRAPTAEVLWAIVPILIVIAAAAPALKGLMPRVAAQSNVADSRELPAQTEQIGR
jgi:heme/copper-type cytochrome/quinol oxidase subunit 2